MKLLYKKKKTTLHDIYINKQGESKEVEGEYVPSTNTSDEESMVEVILKDKKQQ